MGLMRGIRKNIKGIYWVVVVMVVVSFVLWGTRLGVRGGRKHAGTVFGKKVSMGEFAPQVRFAQRYALAMESRTGRTISPEEIENIAWRRVIELREADRTGITIPMSEVKQQIRLTFSPQGTFDESLYRNALYFQGVTEQEYAASLRDDMKIAHLERLIRNTVVVSPWELREKFDYQEEQRKIKFHMVESAPLVEVFEVSETGEAYYRSHREEFREPKKVAVQYVMVERKALLDKVSLSEEELKQYYEENKASYKGAGGAKSASFEEVRTQIERVLKDHKADEMARTKAEEVLTLSEAWRMREVAEKNDLALRGTGLIPEEGDVDEGVAREPEFRKAAFNTAMGEVSGIITTNEGYCVLSPVRIVPGRIPPFREVREAAAEKERTQQLKQAAVQAGLPPDEVESFVREHSIIPAEMDLTEEDIRRYYDTHRTEFRRPKKVKVEYLLVEKAPFEKEVKVTEKEIKAEYEENDWKYKDEDGKPKPLADVRAEIEKTLREKKADDKAKERADEIFIVSRPQRLKEYALRHGLELRESRLFARGETIDDHIGDSPIFASIALGTDLGVVSRTFRTEKGYCVVSPIQIVEEKIADFEEVVVEAAEKAKEFKAEILTRRIADDLRRRVREKMTDEKKDFDTACKELGLEIAESGFFRRDDRTIEGLGTVYGVAASAFQTEMGKVSYQTRADKGYFFYVVSEVKPPTDEEFAKERDKYYDDLAQEKGVEMFREWLTALMEEANVKSYVRPAPQKAPESPPKTAPARGQGSGARHP